MAFDESVNNSTNELGTSDKKIMKQGYIEKRGADILSGWKKRYVVLYSNSRIEYYTDASKKQLRGTINILLSNLASKFQKNLKNAHEAVHRNLNNVKHGFDIESTNRTWRLRCENDKVKQEWIDVIRLCIKQEIRKVIKPSKNDTGKCTKHRGCPDIYHCCFELYLNYDEWIIVWALLKLDDKKRDHDENKSKDCDINDKILYLFDNRLDRNTEKLDKAMKTWHIPAGFDDIYEYFSFEDDYQYYCLLNLYQGEQFVFKCKNCKQRRLFIDAICERIYYQDNDIHKIHATTTKDKSELRFSYKPIYKHIKYDNQHDSDKWFHVPISIDQRNHKFLLSIERSSLSFVIKWRNLFSIINFMVEHYFELAVSPQRIFIKHNQVNDEIKKIVTKNSVINNKDQKLISKHGLVVSCNFCDRVTPVLRGINCIDNKNGNMVDESKEIDNNTPIMIQKNECKYGFNCPIYKKVKNNYEYTEYNYKHLIEKNHFKFDYSNKPQCRYKSECKAFKRVSRINENPKNFNCHRFDDLCHLCIYRHPPRIVRNDNIMTNFNKLFNFMKKNDMNQFVSANEMNDYPVDVVGMYTVNNLICEILSNGFEKDLCLTSNDFKNKHYSLLKIVNQKLQSKQYKKYYKNVLGVRNNETARASMLSVLLYTGCDCNYDLCKSQRNGNYSKWKCFDDCLYQAISVFHDMEDYSSYFKDNTDIIFHLYSGLNRVQLKNKGKIDFCYFPTYLSTSYDKQVSIQFAQNNGMLMQFDSNIVLKKQFKFCSLEWISKFPYECEILVARTKIREGVIVGATMNVLDCEMNSLNDKKNNDRLQIVNVSHFDSQASGIKLLEQHEIGCWEPLFLIGQRSKELVSKEYKNYLENQRFKFADTSIDFKNGLKILYSDNTFKEYCDKFRKNKNYQLNQVDIVQMQKKSQVMKYLMQSATANMECLMHQPPVWFVSSDTIRM